MHSHTAAHRISIAVDEKVPGRDTLLAPAAAIAINQSEPISVKRRTKPDSDLLRGPPPRGGIQD